MNTEGSAEFASWSTSHRADHGVKKTRAPSPFLRTKQQRRPGLPRDCVSGCSPCCHVPGPSAFRSVVAEASFLWAVRRKDTERRFHPLLPVFGFVNPKLFLHSLMFLLEQLLVPCSHCSQSKHLKMEKQNEILDQISPIHHELIKKIK